MENQAGGAEVESRERRDTRTIRVVVAAQDMPQRQEENAGTRKSESSRRWYDILNGD